jgi:hypothetical protein
MKKMIEIKEYGSFILLNIECNEPFTWDEKSVSYIRVCMPATKENERVMRHRGFYQIDRLLEASINLKKNKLDFDSLVRVKPCHVTNKREDVLNIALSSFSMDSRFYFDIENDNEKAAIVIADWINNLSEYFIYNYKDKIIGFLALREIDDSAFVHLAAVEKQYRITGAGISLYAHAANECKKKNYSILNGRISTLNTAVMNIYSYLGASFSNPTDVFIKRTIPK